jgi:hypothetical protein
MKKITTTLCLTIAVILSAGLMLYVLLSDSQHEKVMPLERVKKSASNGVENEKIIMVLKNHTNQIFKVIVKNKYPDLKFLFFKNNKLIHEEKEGDRFVTPDIIDINKDGRDEILITHSDGGSCCAPNLSMYFFDSNYEVKKFQFDKWHSVWKGWDDIELDRKQNQTILTATNRLEGYGNTELNESTIKYSFNGDKITFLSDTRRTEDLAVINLRSSHFYEKNYQRKPVDQIQVEFDLNGDRVQESISCKLWERWGRLSECEVKGTDGENILKVDSSSFHPKRLGVLSEKKNGWHVLVSDFNDRLFYNPELKKYSAIK